jgi:RES domain-containing protein
VAASDRVDGVPVIRDAFPSTVRLVTTARLRDAVLKALADNEAELAQLAEIEGATSARLIAQDHGLNAIAARDFLYGIPHAHFVNAAFAYARPREPNRFNGPDRGAWYAALKVQTCLAEVAFHMTGFLGATGVYEGVVEYAEMHASLAGEYLDLRQAPRHRALGADLAASYKAGNALADAVMARGINGIIYPSMRHKGGTCFAVLWPHAVQSVAQGDVWRLTWDKSPAPKMQRMTGGQKRAR